MPSLSDVAAIPRTAWFGPACVALAATILVCLSLDPAGDYPQTAEGPGLTLDEIFNAQIGVEIADPLLAGNGPKLVKALSSLPDHPPFGRLWLGITHEIAMLIHPPVGDHSRVVVACARVGSAIAFGLLVFLMGFVSSFWHGRLAGWGTSLAIVLMPRVFGHAHIAALESVLNLTYAAAFLGVAHWWKPIPARSTESSSATQLSRRVPATVGWRSILFCGILLGLALLTKIQAVFIPIPVAIWVLINWRWRGIVPLMVWGLIGTLVFLGGWPWLWPNPVGNVLTFLGHARERPVIYVWYLGRQIADVAVPWHYPWVLFAITVPLGMHLLGCAGLFHSLQSSVSPTINSTRSPSRFRNWLESREALVLGGILLPLIVFSLPGIAVYDGERLFLMVFPLWGLFIGRGLVIAHEWLSQRVGLSLSGLILAAFFASQSTGLVRYAPCWLSYYNSLVSGISGAERLGFQTTYWGDSLTRQLLHETAQLVPSGSTIDVLPVQHPFQLAALESQCPEIRARGIQLRAFDERAVEPAEYVLVFHRREYWPAAWRNEPVPLEAIFTVTRQNTVLGGLYEKAEELKFEGTKGE